MGILLQASDALNRAKGVNKGLDAVVSLISSAGNAPDADEISELLWALHDQMKRHLDDVDSALSALSFDTKGAA